ncbi:MAG: hypothetical protein MUP68_02010 [Deltaproteobacteria bacterium]|nr:hypothetical protein [Deltaproteobacteria bacterium]
MDRAGADASCLLRRKSSEFTMTWRIPADASGASWPGPQANNRIFARDISSDIPRIPTRD